MGENDSGKTTILDAIRYVLKIHSGEFIQFDGKSLLL
nr:ATP-binding protein [Prevotella intermedia]